MNAEQAEGWQHLAEMAEKIRELEAENTELHDQIETLQDALFCVTTGVRGSYLK